MNSSGPQCSVIGPNHFAMYINALYITIDSHSITPNTFADDLQLSQFLDKISKLLHPMQSCINNMDAWVMNNML